VHTNTGRRLGAFLCWAVVFADIGTSVYYVPGILYSQPGIGDLAGLFVLMTLIVFLLLALKYSEVSVRFPEGGGVVTVAARGLNPWAGAVGGMFILVDYFLTSAISSLSGIQYFQTLVPALSPTVIQLIITLMLLALLGTLNWYGIRESAIVSAGIAVAAFISDIVILLLLFLKVPPAVLGRVFRTMLSGHNLTAPLVLTGFAGAFLAFSGLESISQLSPVMRTPRRKTVTAALALVVVTVGVTSPLLTIFSTTLLTHPELLRQTALAAPPIHDPNQFISLLGFAAGGKLLQVLTAVTASTLLLFAANTAIIGAYHVFLALSRMHFFPQIVERTNKLRGTPHVSILLATVIPMLVLIAVQGQITTLGDMYAFGLLGAFSLTCISLDVIRWRERHGEEHIGDTGEHEARETAARVALRSLPAWAFVTDRLDPMTVERLWHLRRRARLRRQELTRRARPLSAFLQRIWPDARYYLGFLTTALVVIAWATNLKTKPLATVFGGGLTVLGVAISVVHYRYQRARGQAAVFLMSGLRRMPRSLLVVLSPRSAHNLEVVRAACETADGQSLVVLYLAPYAPRPVQPLEFNDPYLFDTEAQRTLAQAAAICARGQVPVNFIYRVGGPGVVLDAWRVLRPSEIVADASTTKELSRQVAPEYVRFQRLDGVRVAHYVKHQPAPAGPPATAAAGENGVSPVQPGQMGQAAPEARRTERAPREAANGTSGAASSSPASVSDESAEAQAGLNIDDYVWTGTELVRRSDLGEAQGAEEPQTSDSERPGNGEGAPERGRAESQPQTDDH
jgi:amino acid transporter